MPHADTLFKEADDCAQQATRCTPSLLSKDHKNVISMRKLLHYYSIYSKETANLPRSETNISLTGPFVSSLILQCSVV